jgi:hypothetical protein
MGSKGIGNKVLCILAQNSHFSAYASQIILHDAAKSDWSFCRGSSMIFLKENPQYIEQYIAEAKQVDDYSFVILFSSLISDEATRDTTLDWVVENDKSIYRIYSLLRIITDKQERGADVQPLVEKAYELLKDHFDTELLLRVIKLFPNKRQEDELKSVIKNAEALGRTDEGKRLSRPNSRLHTIIQDEELPVVSRKLAQDAIDRLNSECSLNRKRRVYLSIMAYYELQIHR